MYLLYFQQPDIADAELDAGPARAVRRMLNFDLQSAADPDVVAAMITPGPAGFIDRLPEPGGPPAPTAR